MATSTKMKWIEFFQAQSQWATTQSSAPAPDVSKEGRNAPRPRARCTFVISLTCTDGQTQQRSYPSLWYAPISPFPARGSETLAKWPASIQEAVLCSELSGMAFKIFHSSAQITSVIQIKAEGDEEAFVSGIPWISLPTTEGLARAKFCGYCTAMLWFQDDKGPFTTTDEPRGVRYECEEEQENSPHSDTGLNSCKQGGCRSIPAVTGTATVLLLLL